jgi:hypothetical protein
LIISKVDPVKEIMKITDTRGVDVAPKRLVFSRVSRIVLSTRVEGRSPVRCYPAEPGISASFKGIWVWYCDKRVFQLYVRVERENRRLMDLVKMKGKP